MNTVLIRSTAVLIVLLAAPAGAQTPSELKERCTQLTTYFDYYGVSRGENSDGGRNWTRIGASIDCDHGRYAQGISAMEALMRRKAFDVPPPDVAATPDGRVEPIVMEAQAPKPEEQIGEASTR
jgi:hypothetical protein